MGFLIFMQKTGDEFRRNRVGSEMGIRDRQDSECSRISSVGGCREKQDVEWSKVNKMSTGDDKPILQIESVSKRYGTAQVLHDVSLELPPGVVGLLGPNGSGKSTLIKSFLGLVSIDKGQGQVLGLHWPSQVLSLKPI